jgi:hypothetical protein
VDASSKNALRNKARCQQYKERKDDEELVLSARRMMAVNAPGVEAALETALQCKAGRVAFPSISGQLKLARAVEHGLLLSGTDERGKKKRSKDKGPYVAWLDSMCGGLNPAQVSAMGITQEFLRKVRQLRKEQSIPSIPSFFKTKYTITNRAPLRMPDPLMCALVAFFACYTFVLSGAVRPTRHLALAMHELFACLHGRWPAILRRLVVDHPELLTAWKGKMPKLQEDIKISQALAQHPDFDELREFTDRYKQYEAKYVQRLGFARLKAGKMVVGPPLDPHPAWSTESVLWSQQLELVDIQDGEEKSTQAVKVASYTAEHKSESIAVLQEPIQLSKPTAVTPATFHKVLKAKDVRYTLCTNETRCPLHDNGPIWEVRKKNLLSQLAKIPPKSKDPRLPTLHKQLRDITVLVNRYERHLEQFSVQRACISEIERTLPTRCAVVYRDFVNMYMPESDGTTNQLKNLQLVILWREKDGEPLRSKKVSNLCSDDATQSCDAYYLADVMDFHCRPEDEHHTGYLASDKFDKIYLVGDHGPHFSSVQTFFNESTFQKTYGLEVESVFLCSYHAYNRCDAAGVEVKRVVVAAGKSRLPVYSATLSAELMNRSNYVDHVCHTFEEIARNTTAFPDMVKPNEAIKIRAICHIQYPSHGVAVFREVSGGKLVGVHDFSPNPVGNIVCHRCSVHRQQLVTHDPKTTCPMDLPSVTVLDRTNLASPDPSRIQGPQVIKASKAKDLAGKMAPKPLQPVGAYPCKDRVVGCSKLHYKFPGACNKHMVRCHPDQALEPYPTISKSSKSSKSRTSGPRRRLRPSEDSPSLPAAEIASPVSGKRPRAARARRGFYTECEISEEESDPVSDADWDSQGSEFQDSEEEGADEGEEEGADEGEEEGVDEGGEEGDDEREEEGADEGEEETGAHEGEEE